MFGVDPKENLCGKSEKDSLMLGIWKKLVPFPFGKKKRKEHTWGMVIFASDLDTAGLAWIPTTLFVKATEWAAQRWRWPQVLKSLLQIPIFVLLLGIAYKHWNAHTLRASWAQCVNNHKTPAQFKTQTLSNTPKSFPILLPRQYTPLRANQIRFTDSQVHRLHPLPAAERLITIIPRSTSWHRQP